MAADRVKQLGKDFSKTYKDVGHSQRRIQENLPKIERHTDILGVLTPFEITFTAKEDANSAWLYLKFLPVFDSTIIDSQVLKITVSETGLPVGNEGEVGACGYWYPLLSMGDLNLEHTYTTNQQFKAVFNYTSYGSQDYHFRLVWGTDGQSFRGMNDVISVGGGTITVPISYSILGVSPTTILRDVYIYLMMDNCAASSWFYISGVSLYLGPTEYVPRKEP